MAATMAILFFFIFFLVPSTSSAGHHANIIRVDEKSQALGFARKAIQVALYPLHFDDLIKSGNGAHKEAGPFAFKNGGAGFRAHAMRDGLPIDHFLRIPYHLDDIHSMASNSHADDLANLFGKAIERVFAVGKSEGEEEGELMALVKYIEEGIDGGMHKRIMPKLPMDYHSLRVLLFYACYFNNLKTFLGKFEKTSAKQSATKVHLKDEKQMEGSEEKEEEEAEGKDGEFEFALPHEQEDNQNIPHWLEEALEQLAAKLCQIAQIPRVRISESAKKVLGEQWAKEQCKQIAATALELGKYELGFKPKKGGSEGH